MRRLLLALLLLPLVACGPDMDEQDRPDPADPRDTFDGPTSRAPVEGTVARGEVSEAEQITDRPPLTRALIERGRERYTIYCAPCHGAGGYGDGVVPSRGFPHPPSYHVERLREAPDGHFLFVIRNGFGAMFPYAHRVPPRDRWAVVAYIRALQLSEYAAVDDLPTEIRQRLEQRSDAPLGEVRE